MNMPNIPRKARYVIGFALIALGLVLASNAFARQDYPPRYDQFTAVHKKIERLAHETERGFKATDRAIRKVRSDTRDGFRQSASETRAAISEVRRETRKGFNQVQRGFDRVRDGFDQVESELERQARLGAAYTALSTLVFDPDHPGLQTALGVGAVSHHGAVAGAIGLGVPLNDRVFLSGMASATDKGDVAGGVSVLVRW